MLAFPGACGLVCTYPRSPELMATQRSQGGSRGLGGARERERERSKCPKRISQSEHGQGHQKAPMVLGRTWLSCGRIKTQTVCPSVSRQEEYMNDLDSLLRVSAGGTRDYIIPAKCLDQTLACTSIGSLF